MDEGARELAPWEVPPDEAYWQAVLDEGEYGEGVAGTEDKDEQDTALGSDLPISASDETLLDQEAVSQTIADELIWQTVLAYHAQDRSVDLPVVGFNRGGLLVKWDDVVGFVPASQLCEGISARDENARRNMFTSQIGNTLTLKVIEVDPAQHRLILSERAMRRVRDPDLSALDRLKPGDVCHGSVTNLCSFGVFVNLGDIEGLIHISELSWGRVSHPSDVLQSGQDVDVYVLNVDRERGRVGLSLKRLHPDPWDMAETKYEIGQLVRGIVTNVVSFGAFVRIEEGLEGLIHNSAWANSSAQQRVREGDVVQVRVASIDRARHRMGLTMEQIGGDQASPPIEQLY